MSQKTNQPKVDEIFNQIMTETSEKLKELNSKVKTIRKEFDGTNWGSVGDLGRILEQLKHIV